MGRSLIDMTKMVSQFIRILPNNIIITIAKRQQEEEAKVINMMGSFPICLSEDDISKVKCCCMDMAKKSFNPYLYWMNYILGELRKSVYNGIGVKEMLKKFID